MCYQRTYKKEGYTYVYWCNTNETSAWKICISELGLYTCVHVHITMAMLYVVVLLFCIFTDWLDCVGKLINARIEINCCQYIPMYQLWRQLLLPLHLNLCKQNKTNSEITNYLVEEMHRRISV